MATQNLELFYKPTCPYCHKVMSFMEQNNIELPMHDIVADNAARERLIEVGGKRQVPCLFIYGKAMLLLRLLPRNPSSSRFSRLMYTNPSVPGYGAEGFCVRKRGSL